MSGFKEPLINSAAHLAHVFSGLILPHSGRRSAATSPSIRLHQTKKSMCHLTTSFNQRFPKEPLIQRFPDTVVLLSPKYAEVLHTKRFA